MFPNSQKNLFRDQEPTALKKDAEYDENLNTEYNTVSPLVKATNLVFGTEETTSNNDEIIS